MEETVVLENELSIAEIINYKVKAIEIASKYSHDLEDLKTKSNEILCMLGFTKP